MYHVGLYVGATDTSSQIMWFDEKDVQLYDFLQAKKESAHSYLEVNSKPNTLATT